MIAVLPIAIGIMAGIGLYASAYHLLVWLRQQPRNPTNIIFAFLILTVTGQILADGITRMSSTLSLAVFSFKIGISLAALTVIVLIWFIAFYTRVKPRRFLVGLTAITSVVAVVNLALPFSVVYTEISALSFGSFPWGEQFAVFVGTPSPWQIVNIAIFLVLFGYAFYASRQQYLRGEHKQALALAAGITFVIGGTIFDFLIDFGLISSFISLFQYSFFGLVVIMSFNLADEVVQAGTVKKQLVESEARLAGILDIAGEAVISTDESQRIILFNKQAEETFGYTANQVIGQPLDLLLPERFQAIHRDHIAAFASAQEITRDMGDRPELYGLRQNGQEFNIEASISKLSVDGQNYYTVVLRDISRRKQTELELAQYREHLEDVVEERTLELSHAVEELQTLNQISRMVATVTDLPAALNLVCKIITQQLQSGATAIRVLNDNKEKLTVLARYTDNPAAEIGGEVVYPWQAASPMAQKLSQGRTMAMDQEEARNILSTLYPQLNNVLITAMMIVPLRIRGDLIGLMSITRAEEQTSFTDGNQAVAEAMAGYVAGAIENTRLVERMQESAVAEERNRLAQDLHDSVTQTMFSIASIAETLPKVWEQDQETGRQGLESLQYMTQGALAEMRMLLLELRPTALLEKSLGELLRQLSTAVGSRSEVLITTTIVGDHPFPDEVQINLYRIAQEALSNVTKHSVSTQAKLGLYCTPSQVTLQITDNGRGFDPQQKRDGGRFGLAIMNERAREIGADFLLESLPGQGTEVTVVWDTSQEERQRMKDE
ncbi:MAG: hypothetical protein AMJ56_01995 [Anaerolineae bacterium SG8_19]|jgi:PAS domain S-box-containing protein|nr:MAG: hypothetical protein AMJ56_01995 [Anaerolineae bacterium SG8_19]